jgi:hypothetical protein
MAAPTPPGAPRPPSGPGKLSQRSDLAAGSPGTQGVYAPTGQPYGQATAERSALKAAPIPRADMFAPPGAAGMPGGGPIPAPAPGGMANSLAAPPGPSQPPPGMPNLHQLMNRPTMNPQEPVTAGLPVGAGAGPTPVASPLGNVLAYLASTPFATDAVKDLALKVDRPGISF